MPSDLLTSICFGLALLGAGLILVDLLLAHLLRRMFPAGLDMLDGKKLESELSTPDLRRVQIMKARYREGTSHKMGKIGTIMLIAGLVAGGVLYLLREH